MAKYRFLVVVEKGDNNYGAYIPDLPGCITVGDTIEETLQNMQEALSLHLEGMLKDGETIPSLHSTAEYVEVEIPNQATVR